MVDCTVGVVTLILDQPTCLGCIATKCGITAIQVEAALGVVADTLMVYREVDHCRLCDEIKEVCSVRQRT